MNCYLLNLRDFDWPENIDFNKENVIIFVNCLAEKKLNDIIHQFTNLKCLHLNYFCVSEATFNLDLKDITIEELYIETNFIDGILYNISLPESLKILSAKYGGEFKITYNSYLYSALFYHVDKFNICKNIKELGFEFEIRQTELEKLIKNLTNENIILYIYSRSELEKIKYYELFSDMENVKLKLEPGCRF